MLLTVASTLEAWDCGNLDRAAAERVIAARDLRELDAVAPAASAHPALRAVYRSRRLELQPAGEEERRYLRALPRTEVELRCVYVLTYPGS